MEKTHRPASAVQVVKGESVEVAPTDAGEHDVRMRLGPTDCADVTVHVAGVRLLLNVDGNGRVVLWAVRAETPAAAEGRDAADLWFGNVATSVAEQAVAGGGAAGQAKAG